MGHVQQTSLVLPTFARAGHLSYCGPHLVPVQKHEALGNVQSNLAPFAIPPKDALLLGEGIALNAIKQIAPLHVLQHQQGEPRVQAGAVELDNVRIKVQSLQQADLLQQSSTPVSACQDPNGAI